MNLLISPVFISPKIKVYNWDFNVICEDLKCSINNLHVYIFLEALLWGKCHFHSYPYKSSRNVKQICTSLLWWCPKYQCSAERKTHLMGRANGNFPLPVFYCHRLCNDIHSLDTVKKATILTSSALDESVNFSSEKGCIKITETLANFSVKIMIPQ